MGLVLPDGFARHPAASLWAYTAARVTRQGRSRPPGLEWPGIDRQDLRFL